MFIFKESIFSMSRAFVNEDNHEEAPFIPPRAELPLGINNYVTQSGYDALLKEKADLESEQKNLPLENETEHRRASMVIDGKLKLLNERIASARIIDLTKQPKDEVRFGAIVQFKRENNNFKFQIVGVDEADINQNKIAFISPIARALTGKKKGEKVKFQLGNQIQELKILDIYYPF